MANKKDFRDALQENLSVQEIKLSKDNLNVLIDVFWDTVVELTAQDGKLQFVGYGNFEVVERAARKGRNPQSGEEIEIAASKKFRFKAGKKINEALK